MNWSYKLAPSTILANAQNYHFSRPTQHCTPTQNNWTWLQLIIVFWFFSIYWFIRSPVDVYAFLHSHFRTYFHFIADYLLNCDHALDNPSISGDLISFIEFDDISNHHFIAIDIQPFVFSPDCALCHFLRIGDEFLIFQWFRNIWNQHQNVHHEYSDQIKQAFEIGIREVVIGGKNTSNQSQNGKESDDFSCEIFKGIDDKFYALLQSDRRDKMIGSKPANSFLDWIHGDALKWTGF